MSYNFIDYLELLAAIFSLFCLGLNRKPFVVICCLLLLITIVVEFFGKYLSYAPHMMLTTKMVMYNVFNTVEFLFYVWAIRLLLQDDSNKNLYRVVMAIMVGFSIINITVIQGYKTYNSLTTTVCGILLILLCLYKLFQADEREQFERNHQLAILLFLGSLFFYYTINFGNNTLLNVLVESSPVEASNLYRLINGGANTVLYIGIICALVFYTKMFVRAKK